MVSTGIVRKWLEERGFGFITPDDGSEDIFFHATGVKRNGGVVENDKVMYYVKNLYRLSMKSRKKKEKLEHSTFKLAQDLHRGWLVFLPYKAQYKC